MGRTRRPLTLEDAHTRGYELVRAHTERFLALVTALDGDDLATPVPDSDWTVGEVVTHVHSVVLRFTVDRRRAPTRHDLAAQNAGDVAELGLNVPAAVASIREQLDALATAAARVPPDRQLPFHAGQTVTLAGGWGILLGELLAHGDDLARATGRSFAIPSDDLEILFRFTGPVLQGWLRATAAAHADTWTLRLPFGDVHLAFDRGRLRWGIVDPAPADHVIAVRDAADFALTFPYRRRPITDPAVALLAARFHDL